MKDSFVTIVILFFLCTYNIFCERVEKETNRYEENINDTTEIQQVEIPRIDFVLLSDIQIHEDDTNVIWFDDFDEKKYYMESRGDLDSDVRFGDFGSSMKAGFKKGDVSGEGDRKLAFGDFPNSSITIKPTKKNIDEIYWRIYVKHEHGWEGAPAKMSRVTSIVSNVWQQAMIAHVWSGENNSLTLDPARGVEGQTAKISTTKYNDFDNLTWLGNKPGSDFKISSTEESGYWVLVESRAKLNTPGKNDGINQLWIDGRLESERLNLNFRGSYTKHGINAVFLESYWNNGSPKTQGRWFDNFVVSTQPIGPVVCPPNPTMQKTPYFGPGELDTWEVEISSDYYGNNVVYQSNELGNQEIVTIDIKKGFFRGSLDGKTELQSGGTYFCRVRQKSTNGEWSEWSRWHQEFKVE